ASRRRRAESLGSVGVGGFLGMMTGPVIGDVIFESGGATSESFTLFFTLVGALSLAAGIAVSTVSVPTRRQHGDGLPFRTLMHRYWPGMILMVSLVFTTILTIHMTFLERYAHFRAFDNIRWFFLIYGTTAIILRVVFRRVPERYGRRRLCVFGLASMGAGLLLLIPVHAEWHLILPAFLLGVGHTFIFPSMVDLAANALPEEHRGVGTSLVLGAGDIGFLLGSIAWGHLIEFGSYETTFITGSLLAFTSAAVYFWTQRKKIFERSRLNTAATATS
ncbi:MAG: MFS transporter, partial [Planctomycetes bacterium]|nr:MFS transporter [Planctomycetota bacterium]